MYVGDRSGNDDLSHEGETKRFATESGVGRRNAD